MFEIGRLCMKIAGREAGKYCVVVKKMDEKFVMITGPRELTAVKRRRCNVNHLEPMLDVLSIKSDASDSDVLKAYQKANLTKKLGLEPGARPATQKGASKRAVQIPKEAPKRKAEPKPVAKAKKPTSKKEKPKEPKKAAPKKANPKKAVKAEKPKPVKAAPKPKKAAAKAAAKKTVRKPAAKKAVAKKPTKKKK